MFRRFEHLIAEGVLNWPNATKFIPGPEIGLTTFTARFRDAITSFRRFRWKSTKIDTQKFDLIGTSAVIKHDGQNECVWYCKREAAGRAPAGMSVDSGLIPESNASPAGILSDLTLSELQAFCLLLSNKRLIGPIIFIGNLSLEQVEQLSASFDIGVSYDAISNTTTLL